MCKRRAPSNDMRIRKERISEKEREDWRQDIDEKEEREGDMVNEGLT